MRTAYARAWLMVGVVIFVMLLVTVRTLDEPPRCGVTLNGDMTWEPINGSTALTPGCQFVYQP